MVNIVERPENGLCVVTEWRGPGWYAGVCAGSYDEYVAVSRISDGPADEWPESVWGLGTPYYLAEAPTSTS